MSSDRREILRQAAIVTAGLGIRALPASSQRLPAAVPTPRTTEASNMASTTDFVPGGYRFIPEVFQYSAGVAAHHVSDASAIERGVLEGRAAHHRGRPAVDRVVRV